MVRIRPLALAALFAAAVHLLSACAGSGLPGRVSPVEQAAYDAARAHEDDDPVRARAELEAFVRLNPDSRLADNAVEDLARLAFGAGQQDEAFGWLYQVLQHYPNSERIDSVRLRLARWEHRRGNQAEARALVDRVRENRLASQERRSLHRLLAQLSEDPALRLGHLAELRALAADELQVAEAEPDSPALTRLRDNLEAADVEIDVQIATMTDIELLRASTSLRGRVPASRVRLVMARRALEAGNVELASSFLAQARRHDLAASDVLRLESLELRLGLREGLSPGEAFVPTFREAAARSQITTAGAVGTLGVVLPLSGPYASFGQEALRGVLLAAGIFDREPLLPALEGGSKTDEPQRSSGITFGSGRDALELIDEPAIRLVVRDSAGSPERAASAVRELAEAGEVVAIIGPIFSQECEAAAREAESGWVPLLTLSNREEIASGRGYVFRLRTTADDEVGFLVDYASEVLGAKTFAVLYPSSRYGLGMRKRYWDAVAARGGRLVAAASYEPDATDFNASIRSMIGYDLLTANEKIALEERANALRRGRRLEPANAALLRHVIYSMMGPEGEPMPPLVDFDALFIPDSHEKIQLIAPQLAYHEIDGVQLLGSSEWSHPDLVKVAREHVSGAVIATPFYPESEFEIVKRFVGDYRDSFAAEPGPFSAIAFDATNLVLVELAAGRSSRPQVRDGILRVHGFPGVSGVTSIQPDGNARKRPFLLQAKRRSLVGLD